MQNSNSISVLQTAYEPGHMEACMNLIEKLHYNVNSEIPSNGLTLFLVSEFNLSQLVSICLEHLAIFDRKRKYNN